MEHEVNGETATIVPALMTIHVLLLHVMSVQGTQIASLSIQVPTFTSLLVQSVALIEEILASVNLLFTDCKAGTRFILRWHPSVLCDKLLSQSEEVGLFTLVAWKADL